MLKQGKLLGADFQGHEEEALKLLLGVDSCRMARRMESDVIGKLSELETVPVSEDRILTEEETVRKAEFIEYEGLIRQDMEQLQLTEDMTLDRKGRFEDEEVLRCPKLLGLGCGYPRQTNNGCSIGSQWSSGWDLDRGKENQAFSLKLDIEKTYNNVNWVYLLGVLEFGQKCSKQGKFDAILGGDDISSMGSTSLGSMLQGSHLRIQDLIVLGEKMRVWMIAWRAGEAILDDVIQGSVEQYCIWMIAWASRGWMTKEFATPYGTSLWRSLRELWDELKSFSNIKVGNGGKTSFWKDNWPEEGNLESLALDLYDLMHHHQRVAEFISTVEQFSGLRKGNDELWWQGCEKGFQVHKAYRRMNNPIQQPSRRSQVQALETASCRMQGKTAYNTPLWWGPSQTLRIAGVPGCPFIMVAFPEEFQRHFLAKTGYDGGLSSQVAGGQFGRKETLARKSAAFEASPICSVVRSLGDFCDPHSSFATPSPLLWPSFGLQSNHHDMEPFGWFRTILITSNGAWKLGGFGFTISADQAADLSNMQAFHYAEYDVEDSVVPLQPSLEYTAPELVRSKTYSVGCSSDIFSFGCVAYHLIARKPLLDCHNNVKMVLSNVVVSVMRRLLNVVAPRREEAIRPRLAIRHWRRGARLLQHCS
ncbi:hypothetical protein FXO38_15422 [Capsicum annuum]|nr:hypothetical protein FXO37_32853 [Capsicum annuum]KAF3653910.1 hypothetical protein FXO38_15422 [Capsicum annuum]